MPILLTDVPLFHVNERNTTVASLKDKFKAFTDIGTLEENPDFPNGLRVIQTVCSEKNSYFLLSDGKVHAVGANDRWQCSEVDNIEGMQMVEEEVLLESLNS